MLLMLKCRQVPWSLADASCHILWKLNKTKGMFDSRTGRTTAPYRVWNIERLPMTDCRKRERSLFGFSSAPTTPHLRVSFGYSLPNCSLSIARADVRRALPRIWRRK